MDTITKTLLCCGYVREYSRNKDARLLPEDIIQLLILWLSFGFQTDSLDFDFLRSNSAFMKETKAMYAKQCPGLMDHELDWDLWKVLSVERRDKFPLLPLIIDSFSRDRLECYFKTRRSLQLMQWRRTYPTLTSISTNKREQDTMKTAIQLFFHRFASVIQLPALEKYIDSIEGFCDYIAETTSFIHTLLDIDKINPPFQIDLLIIPNKVVDEDDDDDSDGSDYDSEFEYSDSSDDESEGADQHDPYRDIKDVKIKLDSLIEYNIDIKYEYKYLPNGYRSGVFYESFQNLRQRHFQKTKMNELNEQKNGDCNGAINNFAMPHRNRICIIVDRRKGGQDKHEIFVYKPPIFTHREGFADIPSDVLPEWYFQASYSNVIPGRRPSDTISAKTSANGYVFCLSFHVQRKDIIKCYLHTRSQMIRFLAKDISSLLPEFFSVKAGDENHRFIEAERKSGSKAQTIKLQDDIFDEFREQTKFNRKE